jgi:hypothetical protein
MAVGNELWDLSWTPSSAMKDALECAVSHLPTVLIAAYFKTQVHDIQVDLNDKSQNLIGGARGQDRALIGLRK